MLPALVMSPGSGPTSSSITPWMSPERCPASPTCWADCASAVPLFRWGVALTVPLQPYSPYDLYEKEWRILGSNSVADCYPLAAQNMLTIVDDMRSLITHRVSLEDFDEAVSAMASPDAIKVHLQPNQGHAQ
jgi:hypothetical protein